MAMGGPFKAASSDLTEKITLSRVRLDRQGYDSRGSYWGAGAPLFAYESEDYSAYGHVRAADRAGAKRKLREMYPRAKIGR